MSATESLPMGIDVVLRFHDPGRIHELDRALFSLAYQSFGPVRPVVVTQNFTTEQTRAVASVLDLYRWREQVNPLVVNVEGPPGTDLRSKLINEGFAQGRYRFVAILDYDDYVLERAYDHLTSDALRSQAAISFGRIMVKYVRVFDSGVYAVRTLPDMYRGLNLEDLYVENFCPIHSFVIDRARVSPDDLHFDEGMTRLEDYEFLLRLSMTYNYSFRGLSKLVGVYNWRLDGGNSIQVFEKDEEKRRANGIEWDKARQRISDLKALIRSPSLRPKWCCADQSAR